MATPRLAEALHVRLTHTGRHQAPEHATDPAHPGMPLKLSAATARVKTMDGGARLRLHITAPGMRQHVTDLGSRLKTAMVGNSSTASNKVL